jgi:diguanylate cyclase (GGDEF)-like protein
MAPRTISSARASIEVLGDERRVAQQRFQLALSAHANLESQMADCALAAAERERAADSDHRCTLELEQTSVHDELTGLLNRRGFFAVGENQVEVMRRRAVPGLLLYIDLDGLKTTNDRHGHAAGDELLRAAASVLRRSFRDADTIARLGGDEFVVIATGTPSSAHPMVLARLAAELSRSNDRRGPELRLTWSLGVVSIDPTAGDSLNTLMSVADRRMYVAKRTLHDVVIARSESVPHRSLSVATPACTLINGGARSLESRLYPRGLLVKPAH